MLANFLAGFLIVYPVLFNGRLGKSVSGRTAVFMGKVSFSVYLIHLPIIATLGRYTYAQLIDSAGPVAASLVASALVIAVTYIAAIYVYRYIDAQGMRFSNYLVNAVTSRLQDNRPQH